MRVALRYVRLSRAVPSGLRPPPDRSVAQKIAARLVIPEAGRLYRRTFLSASSSAASMLATLRTPRRENFSKLCPGRTGGSRCSALHCGEGEITCGGTGLCLPSHSLIISNCLPCSSRSRPGFERSVVVATACEHRVGHDAVVACWVERSVADGDLDQALPVVAKLQSRDLD